MFGARKGEFINGKIAWCVVLLCYTVAVIASTIENVSVAVVVVVVVVVVILFNDSVSQVFLQLRSSSLCVKATRFREGL